MERSLDPVEEHAVVVSLRLVEEDTPDERRRLAALAEELEIVLGDIPGGEFGGLDLRAGYCLLYCYGDDAGEVFTAIEPAMADYRPRPGSWVIKRFGSATDVTARRERVDLTP